MYQKYLGQFYFAQILGHVGGDKSQVGQFTSWIREKLCFLGHPNVTL